MTINIFKARIRSPKDALIHLAFGCTIGYLIGFLLIFDGDYDISEHISLVGHEKPTQKAENFNLRCVIIIHRATHKPEKIISALSDGYTKHCQETIYFTNNQKVFDKFQKNHTMYYVDSSLNHFYWSFYQYVMEFSSKVPSQWTFIGDDQTYLIVPNLRNVLHNFDSEKPVVLGKVRDTSTFFSWLFPLSSFKKISVRGGIVFSNSAIDKLSACKGFFFARASDYALYDCSDSHNVQIADPFDEDALRLFNDLPPKQIIAPDSKLFRTSSMKGGKCSDHAVSFGQLSEKDMRVLEYGMTLKVFGRGGLETSESNETTTT
ncbi:hypothetical protein L3Y34_000916 [Caenorhabditis briggsae]|uniref:N-acetylgalactosaminide beta-1,3-galactosyltransferase n=1 Tax=Caenorhabditis briggsae TaxID=6238 RepID=A0AAE9IPM3_CAEBR|nr:hypothetical protein L3Y34_000916 [Caenorhabditis briggsae]